VTSSEHHYISKLIALGAGSLFVGDLFLTWHRNAAGWSGWGLLAGVLALVVMSLIGARVERPLAALLAAIGLLAATALADDSSSRWPAWLGLALAAVTVAA